MRLLRRISLTGTSAILAITAACSSTATDVTVAPNQETVPDGAFVTDAASYTATPLAGSPQRYQFSIVSRYQNRSDATVYLGRCTPTSTKPLFSVEVADNSGANSGYSQPSACVGHNEQFAIAPGATRYDTLTVGGPNTFQGGLPYGNPRMSGAFKLSFDVRTARGDGAPMAPLESRWSNSFVVSAAN